jgi:ribonuclease HI
MSPQNNPPANDNKQIHSHRVTIFTDGSCDPNPGPGGWAALLRSGRNTKKISGGEVNTTNNRMELTAALRALQSLKYPCQVVLYTDSEYLKRGITEWLPNWRQRQWKRKGGQLANVDLWQALDTEIAKHAIHWRWVRGHSGHPENEMVDQMAKKAIPSTP